MGRGFPLRTQSSLTIIYLLYTYVCLVQLLWLGRDCLRGFHNQVGRLGERAGDGVSRYIGDEMWEKLDAGPTAALFDHLDTHVYVSRLISTTRKTVGPRRATGH